VTSALKFIGITNAGIWLGVIVYHICVVGPVFGSDEMVRLLRSPHAIASSLLEEKRFYLTLITCNFIAIIHLIAEWLYMGRAMVSSTVTTLALLLLSGILSAGAIQPYRSQMHLTAYVSEEEVQKRNATKDYQLWSGIQGVLNIAMLSGVGFYFFRVSTREDKVKTFLKTQ
jgi:hypothetical protein